MTQWQEKMKQTLHKSIRLTEYSFEKSYEQEKLNKMKIYELGHRTADKADMFYEREMAKINIWSSQKHESVICYHLFPDLAKPKAAKWLFT